MQELEILKDQAPEESKRELKFLSPNGVTDVIIETEPYEWQRLTRIAARQVGDLCINERGECGVVRYFAQQISTMKEEE